MFKDITIDELREMREHNNLVLIDVRSPSEYREATIPGSINIPFFNDEERSEIGTLYKQVSVKAAQERGLEIASAKLPDFVRAFSRLGGKKVVYCWRGGMRSKTTATVLDLMNIHVHRLQGGIRSYRNWVVDTLETIDFTPKAYVLNGNTGSGKTLILKKLQKDGYPVLDLEGMAGHKGSIFGHIGDEPKNQKTFDALLLENMLAIKMSPFVLLEAESKRIGKVILPPAIFRNKENGIQLFIEMPMAQRVANILEDYQPWEHQAECIEAFEKIKRRIHTPVARQISEDLKAENYPSAVALLLEYYYDHRYEHTARHYTAEQCITIKANNVDEAYTKVRNFLPVRNNRARLTEPLS